MKFLILTHVPHIIKVNKYFGYKPYILEMNIWLKQVDELIVLAPLENRIVTAIDLAYQKQAIDFRNIPSFNLNSFSEILKTIFKIPIVFWHIFFAIRAADHIHLRCPGNIGLLGCFVQILFPSKNKTAKYAGNWDPNANQPWSYRLQKWILNNTFLTRNMQVLVYGNWKSQSKNVKSFFTATYREDEKKEWLPKRWNAKINFIFVGTLTKGKNPLYAIQIVQELFKKGYDVTLDLYGEGILRVTLEKYISEHNLENFIFLKGNQSQEVLKQAYQQSHFVVLPSESEGWPKALAEGMFWGAVPLGTQVSCVPYMLGNGARGIILEKELINDVDVILSLLQNQKEFDKKSIAAQQWSQKFTTDFFESQIKQLLQNQSH